MNTTLKVNSLNTKKTAKKKSKFDDALIKLGYSSVEKSEKLKKPLLKEE